MIPMMFPLTRFGDESLNINPHLNIYSRQARPAEAPLDVYGSAVAPVGTSAPGME